MAPDIGAYADHRSVAYARYMFRNGAIHSLAYKVFSYNSQETSFVNIFRDHITIIIVVVVVIIDIANILSALALLSNEAGVQCCCGFHTSSIRSG